MLRVSNLTKNYQTGDSVVKAVDNVNINVKTGEFVSIMGPSGSGKSTFLSLIGGLEKPTSGEIKIADQSIEHLSEDQLALMRRDNVSFIYQFFSLLPELSAEENIILPLLIAKKPKIQWQNKLDKVLEQVGLSNRRNHSPSELSGGEQQRVAIARAILANPNILIADEPTGSLDTHNGQEILHILKKSVDDYNQTLIMVTHDPKIAAYADRIVYFRDGQIIDETSNSARKIEEVSSQLNQPLEERIK